MNDNEEVTLSIEEMENRLFPEKKVLIDSISKKIGNFGEPRGWIVTYKERV